jgi:urea transport system substrate-binding protein
MKNDFTLWTVDDEEVVTSGLGHEVSSGTYVSFDYFMTIKHQNNKDFLDRYQKRYGSDALMNTVGVGMYNAAHMGAMAIEKAGKVDTSSIREALKGIKFDKAPQGTVEMRALDHQAVLPSYLMRVREGWSSVNDMFEQVQTVARAVPQDARCNLPL